VRRYQKGKTNLDFTGARDSERQWYQLGHMQVCTLLQTDNHASTPPLSFLQAGCPSCRPTNSVKALKAYIHTNLYSAKNRENESKALKTQSDSCIFVFLPRLCRCSSRDAEVAERRDVGAAGWPAESL